ncbi:MAG: molybdopterin-guanine dinucleotide biosynthesis protein B [Candidatus Bathyarchaeia archaeon]|jgi:molybdopterin-guanine dinucleotide biosynthesis protein B
MARFVAVVGGKHSGKTTLIQHLIRVLKSRGFRVATIKEMPNTATVDTPSETHDTWKHGEAGAEIVVASPLNETTLFIKRRLSLNEMVPFFQNEDFVLLEGFEKEKLFAKIITAKTVDELAAYLDGLAVAISGILTESAVETKNASKLQLPVLNANTQAEQLADIVEQKAFTILPNLVDCAKCHPVGECGYVTCYEHAKAIVSGKSKALRCPLDLKETFLLEVNGVRIPLKDFPQTIVQNILIGMTSSLHGAEEIKTLRIEINPSNPN